MTDKRVEAAPTIPETEAERIERELRYAEIHKRLARRKTDQTAEQRATERRAMGY